MPSRRMVSEFLKNVLCISSRLNGERAEVRGEAVC